MSIRPARHDDLSAMRDIAAAGGSPDADERYLDHVASHGRLLVAIDDDAGDTVDVPVGFAGGVQVGDVAMVTDLFVAPSQRGRRVGSELLHAVTEGWARRMTFSSTHPAALQAYTAAGLAPQWRLLTLRGVATGGGEPLTEDTWRHDRRELVEYFRGQGAVVGADSVVLPGETNTVWRLVSDRPEAAAERVLAALPAAAAVEWSIPEPHPLAAWLQARGFAVVDSDVFCATDGVHLVPQLCSVHRGLL